jgi:hypothetical protein
VAVAIGTAGLDATDLPYRWGLGGDLAPGASTTVTGHIKVTQDFKATSFWAALVDEPGTVVQTGTVISMVSPTLRLVGLIVVATIGLAAGQESSPPGLAGTARCPKKGVRIC